MNNAAVPVCLTTLNYALILGEIVRNTETARKCLKTIVHTLHRISFHVSFEAASSETYNNILQYNRRRF